MTLPPGVPLLRPLPSLTALHPRDYPHQPCLPLILFPVRLESHQSGDQLSHLCSLLPVQGVGVGVEVGTGPQEGGKEGKKGPSQAPEGLERVNWPSCGLFC